MLTFKIKNKIDLPDEPGQWIETRMPGGDAIREARHVASQVALRTLAQLTELAPSTMDAIERGVRRGSEEGPSGHNALDGLDVPTLLRHCIVAWSYDEPVTPANIAALDEATQDYVAERIPLPGSTSEEDRKNFTARSMKPSRDVETHPTDS